MRNTTQTGNSLAFLLSQNQKRTTVDVRGAAKRTSPIGNSLAYLLSHKQ
jgi:hypothetical protein